MERAPKQAAGAVGHGNAEAANVISIPVDLYLAAKLTSLGRSIITAFIHEGLPDVDTKAEDYLRRFARYGWDPYETDDAHRIYDGTMAANDPTKPPKRLLEPMMTFPDKRAIWNRSIVEATNRITDIHKLAAVVGKGLSNAQSQETAIFAGAGGYGGGGTLPSPTDPAQGDPFQPVLDLARATMPEQMAQIEQDIRQRTISGQSVTASQYYEQVLETVFGYKLEIASNLTEEQRVELLRNLATSNADITNYFNKINFSPANDKLGLDMFRKYFAERGNVTVYLGAEVGSQWQDPNMVKTRTSDPAIGFTPDDAFGIFLGSQVTTGTMTHEFFHQLDRAVERCSPDCLMIVPQDGGSVSLHDYMNKNQIVTKNIPFDADNIYGKTGGKDNTLGAIQGYVGTQQDYGSAGELFADLGMTAVLDGKGEQVYMRDKDGNYTLLSAVGWEDSNTARAVRSYFENVMRGLRP